MIALVIGTVLALAALAYVLYPIFFGALVPQAPATPVAAPAPATSDRELAVAALREIEFDRATGKLSDADYEQLKRGYTARAVAAMRRESADAAPRSVDDAIEAAVSAVRERRRGCPSCGPRPEPDAIYCSSCGRYLAGSCAQCGATVTEPGSRFCGSCGTRLAAA